MGIIKYIRDWMSYIPAKVAYERGFYEASKITQTNKDFWNATSDFENTAIPERNIMRGRARWLSANNAIMHRIDEAIINNVVGNGITMQSITGSKKFDDKIEKQFKEWCSTPSMCDSSGRFTFFDMQRIFLKSRMVDGEIFIYKRITRDGLKLQILEADSLDTSKPTSGMGMGTGIETNGDGSPKVYHFLDANNKPFTIKAEYIINYFKAERPSQYRGVSEYKQAVLDIKNFSAFQSASIIGARSRANIAYSVTNSGGANPYGADLNERVQTINGVSVMYLKAGEKIDKLDPDSVATDYTQFSEITIRSIASARLVSYELAFQDYSKVNFASSRASLLQDFKRFDYEQSHLINYILNDIYTTWFNTEVLRGTIRGGTNYTDKIKPRWVMPRRDWVDPLKDATALEKKIEMNLTTETDACLANGYDYEEILQKKAKEMELKKQYGVPDLSLVQDTTSSTANDNGKTGLDTNLTGDESAINKKEK